MKQETIDQPMLLDSEGLCRAAECLKVLAHPVRLQIIGLLMQGEFPVGKLAELCRLPAHQTCEHLRLMQSHSLLASARRGRSVYYRIAAAQLPGIMECVRRSCGKTSE